MGRSRAFTAPSGTSGDDPLSAALRPPPGEEPAARSARERAEALAKARSDAIDSALQAERDAKKRRKPPVKVLLLGQSESGKSTTLKNFQLTYARKAWAAERDAWRAVIQLNLVRAVNTIADAVAAEHARATRTSSDTDEGIADMYDDYDEMELDPEDELDIDLDPTGRRMKKPDADAVTGPAPPAAGRRSVNASRARGRSGSARGSEQVVHLTEGHRALLAALNPLRAVQRNLELRLGAGAAEEGVDDRASADYDAIGRPLSDADRGAAAGSGPGSGGTSVSFRDITNDQPGSGSGSGSAKSSIDGAAAPISSSGVGASLARFPSARRRRSQEFFVHAGGWKSAVLGRFGRRDKENASSENGAERVSVEEKERSGAERDLRTLAGLRAQMRALWGDRTVREVMKVRRVRLFDSAEFFLSAVDRIASPKYSPADADIVRARLRTVGVQEYAITLDSGPEPGREWRIYDVGGARSARAQWAPYFDDVHAILFLAPMNVFDMRLAEDARINRLDDSLQLWRTVCSHPLLARTELVLFLNKCDLLERKLRSGVRFSDYVKTFEGPNEATAVGKWLKQRFADMCRHYSKESRGLHIHFTSVIDTEATAKTLTAVQDGILRGNLRGLDLI